MTLEEQYNIQRKMKMEKLGTGNYSKEDKIYWLSFKDWYDKNRQVITKSKNVIYVNFKTKKIIKGASKQLKHNINKAA